ncbi:MAG TPA: hypothetical protein VNA16_01850, partial [Abditibacteriaceae bacterium]|nr:hypothetical protein [Abditibacteriaceae bacterium]
FSDKTGNCRLSWFDWMMRHSVQSVDAADEFTRLVHTAAEREDGAFLKIVAIAATKLDAPLPTALRTGQQAQGGTDPGLQTLQRTIQQVRQEHAQALVPLTVAEREELQAKLYIQAAGPKANAPRFNDKIDGRRVSDLLEKMDRRSLMQAAATVSGLSEQAVLRQLTQSATRRTRGKAQVMVGTPAGKIVFGGSGNNEYRLNEMADVCAVVDVGGDDVYIEGAVTAVRPVLVLLDLNGNDTYRGEQPGIQGGAVLGVSLLIDAAGNDTYTADDIAQGSALGGVGLLVDKTGDDKYLGDKRVQGQAVCGLGVLIDRAGNDGYRTALLGQGVGGPLGFGLLDDLAGNDHYYAGGKYADGYDDSPGYNGWSQGVGVGPRGTANGGIGTLLDGGGDDVYEADYFSHGGGYWFALGFARDFGGNDQRVGSTRTAWDGSPRTEARFLRYGNGFGVHYAAGYLFDDTGNDIYFADFAGVGFAWDIGITSIIDMAGNDRYESGSGVGACFNSGLSMLFDAKGDDTYISGNAGSASEKSEYHPDEPHAYNFAYILDLQGQDTYPADITNNRETERGWPGGLVIDR